MKELNRLIEDIGSSIDALRGPKEISPFRVKDDLPVESIKRILKSLHQVVQRMNEQIPDGKLKMETDTEKKLNIVNKLLKQ